jgi:hypothetical protein
MQAARKNKAVAFRVLPSAVGVYPILLAGQRAEMARFCLLSVVFGWV